MFYLFLLTNKHFFKNFIPTVDCEKQIQRIDVLIANAFKCKLFLGHTFVLII